MIIYIRSKFKLFLKINVFFNGLALETTKSKRPKRRLTVKWLRENRQSSYFFYMKRLQKSNLVCYQHHLNRCPAIKSTIVSNFRPSLRETLPISRLLSLILIAIYKDDYFILPFKFWSNSNFSEYRGYPRGLGGTRWILKWGHGNKTRKS